MPTTSTVAEPLEQRISVEEGWEGLRPQVSPASTSSVRSPVTARAIGLGLLLTAGIAALNCWIETVANVHFVGGVQMPFGVVFTILVLVVGVNWPLKCLGRRFSSFQRYLPPLSSVELITIYAMMLFGALISTPGADNLFLTVGPALFYYASRENGWADTFYSLVPRWFAPGWNGQTYRRDVIEPLYLGGLTPSQVPWHAWIVMLVAWSVFLLLIYSTLFFVSLLLRRQWIEHEALAFPLIQLPLQMVEVESADQFPPARLFWGNRTMWVGFAIAAFFHGLRGLNNFYPQWPVLASFQGNNIPLVFTEKPWSALSTNYFLIEIYFGGIGIAYLLTRELALSFWVFFLLTRFEVVLADMLGFPAGMLPQGPYVPFGGKGQPTFIEFQSIGAWTMMGLLLFWTARDYFWQVTREAFRSNKSAEGEPFAPRTVLLGLVFSIAGLLGWSWFSGINIVLAAIFFCVFLVTSTVLARLVVEGGFLFPQATFMPLEWMTLGMVGTSAIGASNLTKLSFLQAEVMTDMRTNTLPAFLHTFKLAHHHGIEGKNLRRLMYAVAAAIVVSLGVTLFTTIATLYSNGALASYSFSATLGPQRVFTGAAAVLAKKPSFDGVNALWMVVGALVVWAMVFARSRYFWFPLHPLGYLAAPGYGIAKLWFSFFLGWLIKTMIMKFGGNTTYVRVRPMMIGLILGNATAMVFWMIVGFFLGGQIAYWPA